VRDFSDLDSISKDGPPSVLVAQKWQMATFPIIRSWCNTKHEPAHNTPTNRGIHLHLGSSEFHHHRRPPPRRQKKHSSYEMLIYLFPVGRPCRLGDRKGYSKSLWRVWRRRVHSTGLRMIRIVTHSPRGLDELLSSAPITGICRGFRCVFRDIYGYASTTSDMI